MKNLQLKNSFRPVLALGLSAMLMLGACSKVNEQVPYENINPEDVFNSPARIEKAAIGMYDALQNAEFLGGRALIYIDQRGNDANVASYFGQIPTFNMLSNNATALLAWTGAYRTIFEANYFMGNLQKNESVIGADAAAVYYAEAKFCRAVTYYYLVNIFAQTYVFTADASHPGVPLMTTAPMTGGEAFDPKWKMPRATVKQVYDQIIKDLTEAAVDLPDDWGSGYATHTRATKGAANGLLSRVYLTAGNWPQANTAADKVIASPADYDLDSDPYTSFNRPTYNTSSEIIFNIAMNNSDNPNTNNAIGQHYSPSGRGDITVNPDYLTLPNFGPSDKRKNDTMIVGVGSANYTGKYAETPFDSWVPILRYAEVLLNKAEALARIDAGVSQEALDIINEIRERSNATALALPATKQALIDLILNERRIELAFEGFGMIDFVRTKRNIPARGANQPEQDWNDNLTPWPIPFQETQQNTNLAQNPGYN